MIIVITGPTGVGKTKLSIELAKEFNGEIINADSMQIYKGLNIGTAKILEEEKENITHHLFDIKEVTDDYTVFDFQKDCRSKINEIQDMKKTPIIVGGTGLYLKAALYNYTFPKENKNNDLEQYPTDQLYAMLLKIDPNIKIDKYNRRRLIRAINYYQVNNHSINKNNQGQALLYDAIFIGLTTDRKTLYNKIDNRVDKMINDGLIDEVKKLYDLKIFTKPIINGIGYKELYQYFDDKITKDEAIDLIKRNSRRYAKRQYTFFNHQLNINWFNVNYNDFNQTVLEVIKFIDKK